MVSAVKEKYIKYREAIFLTAFLVYYCAIILNVSMLQYSAKFNMLIDGARVLSCGLLCIIFFMNLCISLYIKWEVVLYAAVAFILLIIAKESKIIIYLPLWLIMCCAKDISFKKIISISLITSMAILTILFLLSMFGIVENRTYIRSDGTVRNSLGFQYTTTAPNMFITAVLMYMLLASEIKWIEVISMFWINLFLYFTTDTNSAFLVVSFSLIGYLIIRSGFFSRFISVILLYVSTISAPAAFALCMLLQKFYSGGGEKIEKLNSLLSGRLKLAKTAIDTYGFSAFGKEIEWVGGINQYEEERKAYNYVDSSFIQYLLNFGAVYIILTMVLYVWYGIKALKHKNVMLAFIFIVIIVHSIFDPQLMWLEYNPFLIYAFAKDDTV